MSELLHGSFSAVLVLDDCDPDQRAYIWNRFKVHSPRIKIVSISNEYDDTTDIIYVDISPLENEQLSRIIQSYTIPKDEADRWAIDCSGSPRMAHVVGENLVTHPEDILRSPSTVSIWDRWIVGNDDPNTVEVAQRRLVLQYISLFKRFGYGLLSTMRRER